MMNIVVVGLGGCLGSVMRYLMVNEVGRLFPNSAFPYGTLAVNMIGCFVIALIGELGAGRAFLTAEMRLFLFVGILGGFTTFSAFGYETFYFIKTSQFHLAFLNVTLQIVLGLAAVWLGYLAGRALI
jgi:fluoride exporter